jgi:hypothetical protein
MDIKSQKFSDYFTINLYDKKTVFFSLIKLENIFENLKLVSNTLKNLINNDFHYVVIEIPTRNSYSYKKSIIDQVSLNDEYSRIIGNYKCKAMETNKYNVGLFECEINQFFDFYKSNLYRLARNNILVYTNQQIPDEDGWYLVVNKKKRKNENRIKVNKILNSLKKKYRNI